MTDIKQILSLIDKINQDCKKVLLAKVATDSKIQVELEQVDADAKNLVKEMKTSQTKYEAKHFEVIKSKVQKLVDALLDDYFDTEDADFQELYGDLQKELLDNGFLASMFRAEKAKSKK